MTDNISNNLKCRNNKVIRDKVIREYIRKK